MHQFSAIKANYLRAINQGSKNHVLDSKLGFGVRLAPILF
jgi:hypothetical protein